ncbi:hypothetical protein V2595_09365 [Tenacibaculum maritimum]|uniref:hypothetical protein n=1 Tax=Tenacibaculum maritimum TaxID=107401 RepID=UPI001F1ECDF0|nr:hypothetical protein [Tenacibaculum maritimum]
MFELNTGFIGSTGSIGVFLSMNFTSAVSLILVPFKIPEIVATSIRVPLVKRAV